MNFPPGLRTRVTWDGEVSLWIMCLDGVEEKEEKEGM